MIRVKLIGATGYGGTSECSLVVGVDTCVNRLRGVSSTDTLMTGQAGSALQNANQMSGLPEAAGHDYPGIYP